MRIAVPTRWLRSVYPGLRYGPFLVTVVHPGYLLGSVTLQRASTWAKFMKTIAALLAAAVLGAAGAIAAGYAFLDRRLP